ncbi:MAG TPA: hypothetical protein VNO14_09710 [Blastocatellia bacterium]|nr:hypothetical protein [Blastocatellia bacterium]
MFTWWKLYNSVPYESVVGGLSVDTKGAIPEPCADEKNGDAGESARRGDEETSHGR